MEEVQGQIREVYWLIESCPLIGTREYTRSWILKVATLRTDVSKIVWDNDVAFYYTCEISAVGNLKVAASKAVI